MWKWKEKWFGNKVYVYMSDISHFGFSFDLTTSRFELFIGFFGIGIEW